MWTVRAVDVTRLQGPGGDLFTSFVDALLRAHAFAHSLRLDRVRTNERTNQPDGGVDTRVVEGIAPDANGWLEVPTCWQFKATDHPNATIPDLLREVNKPYARSLLEQGHGYRLAICDSVPDTKVTAWLDAISTEIRAWAPASPPPRVLTADDLAAWAGRYPGVVSRFFAIELKDALPLNAWGKNITCVTPTYVPVEGWADVERRIEDHVLISNPVRDPILVLGGEAGVGKSRLAFEVLRRIPGAEGLVVYTADEAQARRLARIAAARDHVFAVIVADECTLDTRLQLLETLRGHRDRVRVIAIHNENIEIRGGAPRTHLDRIPADTVRRILSSNYPHVPEARRTRYVDLSGGFVRLAADLCDSDALLVGGESLDQGLPSIQSYYSRRLPDPTDRDVLGAVSLVTRVGFREDVSEELVALCRALGHPDHRVVLERASRLKDSPGFLAMGGRYLYVTPKIVANLAFRDAWERWLRHDLPGFLQRLPSGLLAAFQDRVASSASQEVREFVSSYFRGWARDLTPDALTELGTVLRLETLVDTDPGAFLPILESLVTGSPDLSAVRGEEPLGGWGPRRRLVWLMERIVAFGEYFHSAEAILFRLALHETEQRIGNNATAIWRQVHRPYLSGTALPFPERLRVLEARIFSSQADERALAIQALDPIFARHGITRRGQPTIIAGRVPPEDWEPSSRSEAEACTTLPLELLNRMRSSEHQELRDKALEVVRENLHTLLSHGHLIRLRQVVEAARVEEREQARIVAGIESFLRWDAEEASERNRLPTEERRAVEQWLEELKPTDLHGRLLLAMTTAPWDREERARWSRGVDTLATQLADDVQALGAELAWLKTDSATGAGHLGFSLGRRDSDASLLAALVDPASGSPDASFCRGYISGLLSQHPQNAPSVNQVIDDLEGQLPDAAMNLALSARAHTDPVGRALRLVDQRLMPAHSLHAFALDLDGHQVGPDELREIIERLSASARDEEERSSNLHVGLEILGFRIRPRDGELADPLADAGLREVIWRFLEQPGELRRHNDSYHLEQLLKALAEEEPDRAAALAADILVADHLHERSAGAAVLVALNRTHPGLVVQQIGRVLLSDAQGYRALWGEDARELVAALDVESVALWLGSAGVAGARGIAGALPLPGHDAAGNPTVPAITELVLAQFGSDERTLREFCLGGHRLQIYSGDIAAEHELQAQMARSFLSHPLKPIREWARYEVETSVAHAREWRRDDEEDRSLE